MLDAGGVGRRRLRRRLLHHIGGQNRNRIAKLSSTGTGAADPSWNPSANGTAVNALAVSGGDVYVGGDFTQIGGQSRNNIAKLSTTGTGAADASWSPDASGGVHALAVSGGDVYAGGYFSSIGGQSRNRIAKLSSTGTGAADPSWNPGAAGSVRALAVSGGDVYAGGDLAQIGGQARNRSPSCRPRARAPPTRVGTPTRIAPCSR